MQLAPRRPFPRKVRREVNNARLTLLVAMLFTILVATMFRTPPIIFMTGLLCAAPAMGVVMGRFFTRGLAVSRQLPETGSVGDVIMGCITISNRKPFPVFLAYLHPGRNEFDEKVEQNEDRAENIKSFDNTIPDVKESAAGMELHAVSTAPIVLQSASEYIIPLLREGESMQWSPTWKLMRRGIYEFLPASVGARDPLGLFTAQEPKTPSHTITILPRPLRISRLGFTGRGNPHQAAPLHTAVAADASDFHGVRVWRPGEGIRRVHWKSTARTGQLHVVEWEENLDSDLIVVLDTRSLLTATGSASGTPDGLEPMDEALESAITLTASVASYLLEGGHMFQLSCWQHPPEADSAPDAIVRKKPRTAGKRPDVQPVLCTHQARRTTDFADTLKLLAGIKGIIAPPDDSHAFWNAAGKYSLTRLAQHIGPQIQRTTARSGSVLIICSTRADSAGAITQFSKLTTDNSKPFILALDADSFAPHQVLPLKSSHRAPSEYTAEDMRTPHSAAASATKDALNCRVVRQGDSLIQALEQQIH